MTRRSLRVVVGALAGIALASAPAHADRREASLHAHLVGGVARTGDVDGGDADASSALSGVAVRASYATRDLFQYDVALTVLRHGDAEFPDHTFMPAGQPPVSGAFHVGAFATRVDAGVTFRLGVRWIPTVRLAAGAQLRRVGEAVVDSPAGTVIGRDPRLELAGVGLVALGLDHRVNRRLIVGAAASGVLALPIDGAGSTSLEVTAHAAYYWYPRW